MRLKISNLVLLACASIIPIGLEKIAHAAEPEVSVLVSSQRTVSIPKTSAKTASRAILIAEKKNPGWKVVKIKEHSKHWGVTMKKPVKALWGEFAPMHVVDQVLDT
ncbi:MAG: hypothetical protein P8N76_06095 [Pirellulaceae bacterium]|nr:hypothetical protein [Pirellulaceae bacterium]